MKMKTIILLTTMSIQFLSSALEVDILHDIHKNDYKAAEEHILKLLDGDDNEALEAALMGLYLSIHKNNPEDISTYYAILENLLRAIELRNSSYWNGVIAE